MLPYGNIFQIPIQTKSQTQTKFIGIYEDMICIFLYIMMIGTWDWVGIWDNILCYFTISYRIEKQKNKKRKNVSTKENEIFVTIHNG